MARCHLLLYFLSFKAIEPASGQQLSNHLLYYYSDGTDGIVDGIVDGLMAFHSVIDGQSNAVM
jgi:hypothetical protein